MSKSTSEPFFPIDDLTKHQSQNYLANIIRLEINRHVNSDKKSDQAFYVVDLENMVQKQASWLRSIPRVKPYYAVKCNPTPIVLELLATLGCGFDCASKGEIDQVLGIGVAPHRIIYANPCKASLFIRHARAVGVRYMTFDNEYELDKIQRLYPEALMVIRIKVNDSYARCPLGSKFGAHLDQVPGLLLKAKELGVQVVGCSFHVGSGCMSAQAYSQAIASARSVFDTGLALRFKMTYLDIGGGFPGSPEATEVSFDELAQAVNEALDLHFPALDLNGNSTNLTIISELGRYYVASAFTLATSVIAKQIDEYQTEQGSRTEMTYYLNEGVYGSFICTRFDHVVPKPVLINAHVNQPMYLSHLAGPTCDRMDLIRRNVILPEMTVGDWMYMVNMGAYTVSVVTGYCGFSVPRLVYNVSARTRQMLTSLPGWKQINRNVSGDEESDQTFYVVNLEDMVQKHAIWLRSIPRVEPYYAVKCNPTPIVLELLATLGCGFDCASKGEIDQVLGIGVTPDRIIYANPCKASSFIRHARTVGVRYMTFDNEYELDKVQRLYPEALMVIRIKVEDSYARCPLGSKFGADLNQVPGLLLKARELGVQVVGCSFHVGSGCMSAQAYSLAIASARIVFDTGLALGFDMIYLDIGGGFPGSHGDNDVSFDELAHAVNEALDRYFPAIDLDGNPTNLTIISELGRYYVASAFTLVTSVIGKQIDEYQTEQGTRTEMTYHLNDGVYGSFIDCILYDHVVPEPVLLNPHVNEPRYLSHLAGPTCDSMDLIRRDVILPDMTVGDWMYMVNMGAYTLSVITGYCGFPVPRLVYNVSARARRALAVQVLGS
ncbi:unnamed protein product, partial [Medioppia subpectinata]